MSENVVLVDEYNVVVVQCPDEESAERLAGAATFSDGGVSAYLLPRAAFPDETILAELLREGAGVPSLLEYLEESEARVVPL